MRGQGDLRSWRCDRRSVKWYVVDPNDVPDDAAVTIPQPRLNDPRRGRGLNCGEQQAPAGPARIRVPYVAPVCRTSVQTAAVKLRPVSRSVCPASRGRRRRDHRVPAAGGAVVPTQPGSRNPAV